MARERIAVGALARQQCGASCILELPRAFNSSHDFGLRDLLENAHVSQEATDFCQRDAGAQLFLTGNIDSHDVAQLGRLCQRYYCSRQSLARHTLEGYSIQNMPLTRATGSYPCRLAHMLAGVASGERRTM